MQIDSPPLPPFLPYPRMVFGLQILQPTLSLLVVQQTVSFHFLQLHCLIVTVTAVSHEPKRLRGLLLYAMNNHTYNHIASGGLLATGVCDNLLAKHCNSCSSCSSYWPFLNHYWIIIIHHAHFLGTYANA